MPGRKTVIVDYGLGNLRSVFRGLEKAGASPIITGDPAEVLAADAIVLPGVGAFSEGMEQLGPLCHGIREAASDRPVLGICLGMQMLLDWSEEHGMHRGLGIVPGSVRRFPWVHGVKVPHMGWNTVTRTQPNDPLLDGIADGEYFYFVHSFYADTTLPYQVGMTEYQVRFASIIRNGKVYGVQFHPEKSGAAGLGLLANFMDLA